MTVSTPDDPLTSQGWERRFVAVPPRLEEATALFRASGFEVRLVPVSTGDLHPECSGCALALALSRAIYVRRRS